MLPCLIDNFRTKSFRKFLYSTWQDSANIRMPSPTNVGVSESSFHSSYQLQFIPPVIVGLNSN